MSLSSSCIVRFVISLQDEHKANCQPYKFECCTLPVFGRTAATLFETWKALPKRLTCLPAGEFVALLCAKLS